MQIELISQCTWIKRMSNMLVLRKSLVNHTLKSLHLFPHTSIFLKYRMILTLTTDEFFVQ